MTCEELLQIASRIGRGLLESGAEAYRVENSVHYVIEAYDLGSCHVFSIPNYLHIDLTDQDGVTHSCMSRASSMKSVDAPQPKKSGAGSMKSKAPRSIPFPFKYFPTQWVQPASPCFGAEMRWTALQQP